MGQEELFAAASSNDVPGAASGNRGTSFFEAGSTAPLAARMRPQSLDEVAGQKHCLLYTSDAADE